MMMYLTPDMLEEIFLRLPLKSILKFKIVSKEWRSILESRSFAERRRMLMNKVAKRPQILVGVAENHRRYKTAAVEKEEEVEIVYLESDAAATRPSLTCEGLVCIPLPGSVNVLNPSTGEFLRFPSGQDPVKPNRFRDSCWDRYVFPGYWAMGFGKDKVNGSYKVVRMSFDTNQFDILDVNIAGKWRKLSTPSPYFVDYRIKSAYVNGSIYWHNFIPFKILALDLHTEKFRDVQTPPTPSEPSQLVNLEGRLATASATYSSTHWMLNIWIMDTDEKTWRHTYTIRVFSVADYPVGMWFKPLAVSKQGNLFFYNNLNKLFKYCPATEQVNFIGGYTQVLSPIVEDLFPLGRCSDSTPDIRTYGIQHLNHVPSSRISKFYVRIESQIPNILLTAVASLIIFDICICYNIVI